ncbi:ATP-binding protein [bacterium]|nr:ATP-binding protein [bacterium]
MPNLEPILATSELAQQNLDLTVALQRQSAELLRQSQELDELNKRLRLTQEQLNSASKLATIGRLAAGIAHEISTPAQFIGDNLTFLRETFDELWKVIDCFRSGGAPEEMGQFDLDYLRNEVPEALDASQEGLSRVNRIVQAMRRCAHSGTPGMVAVPIEEIIQNCLAVSAGEWKYLAKIETEFDPELPPISCVRADISRIVLNFLVNAAQSIREKGSVGLITIRTLRRGDFAELSIEDDGVGIPESLQSNLFDPFFNTRPAGHGGGQELLMARRVIVDQHFGQLSFYSVPGQGTKFIIELPLAS